MKAIRIFTLFILVAALVACSQGAPSNPPPTAVATQPPKATDTPAAVVATETPTQVPPQSATGSGSCANQYLPVVKGATWTRHASIGGRESTNVATITDVRADGFVVDRKGLGLAGSWTETWNCTKDGLLQLPSNGDVSLIVQGPNATVTVKTLSAQGVTLPRDIKPGDTWSETSSFEVSATDLPKPQTYTITYDFKAVGLEPITVPAGTFNAMRLQQHMTWTWAADPTHPGTIDITDWFAPGVGFVKWAIGKSYGELQSYSIP